MAVIFDCDGVLVDSEFLSCDTDARFMTAAGFPIETADYIRRYIGRPKHTIWAEIAEQRGEPWPDGHYEKAVAHMMERFETELTAVEGVADALSALSGPRAVASSSGVSKLAYSLKHCGLDRFFGDHVYSAEQVARGKPSPDVFLLAACQIGADPADCIVIEDSAAGVTAARRAGMRAIGFTGARHSWPEHADLLQEAGAVTIISSMADLPQTLRQWDREAA